MKKPNQVLRKNYVLILETGLILSLLFLIAAMKADFRSGADDATSFIPDEQPILVDLPQPTRDKIPPKPQKPMLFVEKPNDAPIEDDPIEFLDFDDFEPALNLPPDSDPVQEEIPTQVEIMPELKGGLKKLYSEIEYPKEAIRAGVEGLVVVQFVVDEQGSVTNPRIVRGIGAGCDEEVLRIIRKMEFTPGVQNGRLVKVRMSQPVHFRLNN